MQHSLRAVLLVTLGTLLVSAIACRPSADRNEKQRPLSDSQRTADTSFRATCGVAPGQNLAVFVGRKLELQEIQPDVPPGRLLMDEVFRARYKVLQVYCGDLTTPEVEFEVADHYGRPVFENFDTVLLFLSRAKGKWYHEKYQFQDVYATSDGSWAGCGDPYKYENDVNRGPLRARPIEFKQRVTFPLRGLSRDEIRERYPADLYERRGDRVLCRAGAPLDDLFAVKRDGVLKARELFR